MPGNVIHELIHNDRIVGGINQKSTEAAFNFYKTFVKGSILKTNAKTAEMCKLTENSFRDVNIAFANEISIISSNEGIDTCELINLANRHPRVNILQPGVGVGGHCIAVDPWFIISRDQKNARIIRAARDVNLQKTEWVIEQIKDAIACKHSQLNQNPKIICLGLSFKPDIDDLRGSPALEIAERLLLQGYEVEAVEPHISSHPTIKLTDLSSISGENIIPVVLVKHTKFL